MIGPIIDSVLPLMRANAESTHTDRCTVERVTGTTWNGTKTVDVYELVHEDAPCHFEEPAATSRSLLTDEVVTETSPTLRLSVTRSDIKPDDRITLTAAGSRSNAPAGEVLWVTQVAVDSHAVEAVATCRWTR